MKTLLNISTFVIATVLIFTALTKIYVYNQFKNQLVNDPVVSDFASPLSLGIPLILLITSLLILLQRTRLVGLVTSFFVLQIITIYLFVLRPFYESQEYSPIYIIALFSWQGNFVAALLLTIMALVATFIYININNKETALQQ